MRTSVIKTGSVMWLAYEPVTPLRPVRIIGLLPKSFIVRVLHELAMKTSYWSDARSCVNSSNCSKIRLMTASPVVYGCSSQGVSFIVVHCWNGNIPWKYIASQLLILRRFVRILKLGLSQIPDLRGRNVEILVPPFPVQCNGNSGTRISTFRALTTWDLTCTFQFTI